MVFYHLNLMATKDLFKDRSRISGKPVFFNLIILLQMKTIKNLAEFKRFLSDSASNSRIMISSKVISNYSNQVIKEQGPAPIAVVQGDSFALLRDGKPSYLEFKSAKTWTFEGNTATQNINPGDARYSKIVLTVHMEPEFSSAEAIRRAIDEGKRVCWASPLYNCIKDKIGHYLIICTSNDYAIGLTHQDGTTLNGRLSEFFTL